MRLMSESLYPWLQDSLSKLQSLHQQNRLPHAVLIEGTAGLGKRALANRFSHWLLCQAPQQGKPCRTCKDCLLFQQGTHPDSLWIEPEEAGKQIRIAQIRDLADFMGTHAQQGGYRIIVVAPAEALNIAASNALLKGLEEPGEQTLFLLLSDRPGQLLPTIRSRCQRISMALPDKDDALQWLAEQEVTEPELALSLAGGAPLLAKSLAEADQFAQREALFDTLKKVAGGKLSVPDAAQQWQKGDLLQNLGWLGSLISDILRLQQLQDPVFCNNRDAIKLISRAAERMEMTGLFAFLDKIQEYRQLLLAKHNPNPQLLIEDLLIHWISLLQKPGAQA